MISTKLNCRDLVRFFKEISVFLILFKLSSEGAEISDEFLFFFFDQLLKGKLECSEIVYTGIDLNYFCHFLDELDNDGIFKWIFDVYPIEFKISIKIWNFDEILQILGKFI